MRTSRMMAQPPKKKKKYTNLIVVIIILGIAAYFIGAGAAGGWLAENVINPVFNSDKATAEPLPTNNDLVNETSVPPKESIQAVNLPEASGARVEEKISADKVSLYALQAGAFSEQSNAKDAASEIAAKGGAGYVAYDGELYRVLIAGYVKETDAKDVKDSLNNEEVQTSVFKLESGSIEFKIGAEQSQVEAVRACFNIVPESVTALQQIIYSFDKGDDVDNDLIALKAKIKLTSDNLEKAVDTKEGAMQSLRNYMISYSETFGQVPLSSEVSKVEFSSQLKYNLINIVVDYSAFLDEISS